MRTVHFINRCVLAPIIRQGAVLILIIFSLLAMSRASEAADSHSGSVGFNVGSQYRMVYTKPIQRVSVADPKVVRLTVVDKDEFLLLGEKPGQTSVIVWLNGDNQALVYSVVVRPNIGPLAQKIAEEPAFKNVKITAADVGLIVEGSVATSADQARLMSLIRAYSSAPVTDQLKILQQMMVSAEIRIAAIGTSTLQRLGFDFSYLANAFQFAITGPNALGGFNFAKGAGLDLGSRTPPVSDAFNLFLSLPKANIISVLGALSSYDMAQILAEPTLTVRSGKAAEFLVGGEIPIPVAQGNNGSIGIVYKKFGIQLKLEAQILSPNRILMTVAPEVSDLDFSRAVTISGVQVPAISTRSASTTVELANGQSFILAGLISKNTTAADQAVPYVGDVPILGQFFSRQQNSRERQELVIVATPRLVEPQDKLPRLPGEEALKYRPDMKDMLLRQNSVKDFMVQHGIMP